MKLYFEAYGCTLNAGESGKLQEIVSLAGHLVVGSLDDSEAIVLSTCTVIERTELNMLKRITELAGLGKTLIVSGCMADIEGQKAKIRVVAPNVRFVSTRNLAGILSHLSLPGSPMGAPVNGSKTIQTSKLVSPASKDDIVSIIPISTGCMGKCTYCITRLARGSVRSRSIDEIICDVKSGVSGGLREIRLTSQDTAAYGADIGASLPKLLKAVSRIDGDFRVRVGMLNPGRALAMLPELLLAYASPKIYKFLHLPVQSGSQPVLDAMARGYSPGDFLAVVDSFRRVYPDFSLSTDIIVGFPGECEKDFDSTLEVISQAKPDKVNITRFSPRPETPAAGMDGQVVSRVAKERSRTLTKLCESISLSRNEAFLGTSLDVLVTEKGRNGSVVARTPDYRLVVIRKHLSLGSFQTIRVVEAKPHYMVGKLE